MDVRLSPARSFGTVLVNLGRASSVFPTSLSCGHRQPSRPILFRLPSLLRDLGFPMKQI